MGAGVSYLLRCIPKSPRDGHGSPEVTPPPSHSARAKWGYSQSDRGRAARRPLRGRRWPSWQPDRPPSPITERAGRPARRRTPDTAHSATTLGGGQPHAAEHGSVAALVPAQPEVSVPGRTACMIMCGHRDLRRPVRLKGQVSTGKAATRKHCNRFKREAQACGDGLSAQGVAQASTCLCVAGPSVSLHNLTHNTHHGAQELDAGLRSEECAR